MYLYGITKKVWKTLNMRRSFLIQKECRHNLSTKESRELEALQKFTSFVFNEEMDKLQKRSRS